MIRCAQCSSLVPSGVAACRACGTPTTATGVAAPAAPAAAPGPAPTPMPPVRPSSGPAIGAQVGGRADATLFRAGALADAPTPPPASMPMPGPEPAPATGRGPRPGLLVALAVVGALVLVALVAGITRVVAQGDEPPTTTTTSTSTTTTAPPPPPAAPVPRITAPGPGQVVPLNGAPSVPVSVSVAVEGDATEIAQVVVLVDGVAQTPQTSFAAPVLVMAGPGGHTLAAQLVLTSGETVVSGPVAIEVKDLVPGTCGDLCFNASPDVRLRPAPVATPGQYPTAPPTVVIVCQQRGGVYDVDQVWWDKLPDGRWIADQHVDTPKPAESSGIPKC